jgi:hypothetical protein
VSGPGHLARASARFHWQAAAPLKPCASEPRELPPGPGDVARTGSLSDGARGRCRDWGHWAGNLKSRESHFGTPGQPQYAPEPNRQGGSCAMALLRDFALQVVLNPGYLPWARAGAGQQDMMALQCPGRPGSPDPERLPAIAPP